MNGDANPGSRGFRAETYGEDRVLYIPFSVTDNWDEALLLCRHRGLVASKLNSMTPARAWCVYYTTLAAADVQN